MCKSLNRLSSFRNIAISNFVTSNVLLSLSTENDPDPSVHFSFILFQSDRLFKSKRLQMLQDLNRNVSTSGRVISASVNGPTIANLSQPVVIEFSPHQVSKSLHLVGVVLRLECGVLKVVIGN